MDKKPQAPEGAGQTSAQPKPAQPQKPVGPGPKPTPPPAGAGAPKPAQPAGGGPKGPQPQPQGNGAGPKPAGPQGAGAGPKPAGPQGAGAGPKPAAGAGAAQPKPAPPKPAQPQPAKPVAPVAAPAKMRKRHRGIILSMILCILVPTAVVWWYLEYRAADQYVSHVGFSVRAEETHSAGDILGGLTSFSSGGTSDTDILYQFLQSQKLVEEINAKLDLKAIYSQPENDPVYSFDPEGSIEDLISYWARMVRIDYDAAARLIELRVLAFDPDDARNIAREIFERCSVMINELSAIAREDTTRYAEEELTKTVERLKEARQAVTRFRSQTQIVDPSADVQGQMGLLNNLQQQQAEAIIELDLLRDVARENDPRIAPAERKIEVIQLRIDEERKKFGLSSGEDNKDYSELVGQYEALIVDLEFAQNAYVASQSAYDAALAEASRQSRYLAAYVTPTLAERSTYPQRGVTLMLTALFLTLFWAVMVLVYYSIRDRR